MIRSRSVMGAVVEKKPESTNDKGASMNLTPCYNLLPIFYNCFHGAFLGLAG